MSFQIEFLPESQLTFTYLPNEHLTTVLRITNKNEFPIVFKVATILLSLKLQLLINSLFGPIKVV